MFKLSCGYPVHGAEDGEESKDNSIEGFKYAFEKAFINKVIDRMDQNQAFFAKVLDDEEFKDALMGYTC